MDVGILPAVIVSSVAEETNHPASIHLDHLDRGHRAVDRLGGIVAPTWPTLPRSPSPTFAGHSRADRDRPAAPAS